MATNPLSIVGFGNKRAEADFYPTPPETTEELLKREDFQGSIWECASGDGSMTKVLKQHFKNVFSSDIREDESIEGIKGLDFLNSDKKFDNIITNPPYKYAKEFVLKAKKSANKKIALLLKLVFLEGIGRYEMFQDKDFPLKKIYVFCRRQKIYADGKIGKNSGLIAYAWFVWEKNYSGAPTISWINGLKQKVYKGGTT